jgi:hypothetical protein
MGPHHSCMRVAATDGDRSSSVEAICGAARPAATARTRTSRLALRLRLRGRETVARVAAGRAKRGQPTVPFAYRAVRVLPDLQEPLKCALTGAM